MNILRNTVGLLVLGTFAIACSTSADGDPAGEQSANQTAETSKTDPAAKQDDAKKGDATNAKGDDTAKGKLPAVPGADGKDGEDGKDGDAIPGFPNLPGFPAGDDDDFGDDDDGTGTTIGGGTIQAGGGHVASNNDCCFDGDYFECPDTNACFGGFDVNACIDGCANDFNCTMACMDKMSSAGAPKGCTKKAPPSNIQCN